MPEVETTETLRGGIRAGAKRIGVGERTMYRAAERGEIPAFRVGARWVIPLAAWRRFLDGDWPTPNRSAAGGATTIAKPDARSDREH